MTRRYEAPTTAARIADALAGWRRQLREQRARLKTAAGIAAALQSEHDAVLVAAQVDKDARAVGRLAELTTRQLAAQEEILDAEVILAQIQRHIDELERSLFNAADATCTVAS